MSNFLEEFCRLFWFYGAYGILGGALIILMVLCIWIYVDYKKVNKKFHQLEDLVEETRELLDKDS